MSNVVVYVFLLDNLTGFSNALNETIIEHTPDTHNNYPKIVRQCDPGTTNQILNAVSRELDLDVMPMFTNGDPVPINDVSQESFYNSFIEATIPEVDGKQEIYEKAIDTFNFNSEESYHQNNYINEDSFTNFDNVAVTEHVTTLTEKDLPKSAPFLVAIFETMSNITAQTCAGTLLSSHWVLTAANCVNILTKLYADNKTMTHTETLYTVVAGATDPLTDGSAHNVTAILQPQNTSSNSSRHRRSIKSEMNGPYLTMMRIEPELEGPSLSLIDEKVKKGDVTIFGWILSKNDSGVDTLSLINISALILSEAECQALYSFYNNDVICLFNTDKFQNITQLSSGGPVMMLQGGEVKMLAVAQTDDYLFIAYPLHVHINWIKNVLNT